MGLGAPAAARGDPRREAPSAGPSSLLGPACHAAGTPARTLRQKVAALQKEKKALQRQAKEREDSNLELRQKIEALEQALRELPRLTSSAPTGDQRGASPTAAPHGAADGADRPDVRGMRREMDAMRAAVAQLQEEKEEVEQQLTASDMARRFVTWRYCFRCLDKQNEGAIGFADVIRFETFSPYSVSSLRRAYALWHAEAAAKPAVGRADGDGGPMMDEDDVVKFVAYSEEKSIKEAMDFWFRVADVDGDGYIGTHDIIELFEDFRDCVQLRVEDLVCQLFDMARPARPERGLSLHDLRACKLGAGVLNLLFNHGNGLQSRSTAEFGRGDNPL